MLISNLTDDTGVQCMFIERHIQARGEVAHRPVEMRWASEVHQGTCKLAVWHHNNVQSTMLATHDIKLANCLINAQHLPATALPQTTTPRLAAQATIWQMIGR